MRRRKLQLLAVLAVFACTDTAPPQIGVVVGTAPRRAAEVAAEEQRSGDAGFFEPLIPTSASPVAAAAALDLAREFVANPRVIAVVGHGNSAASLAASPVYNSGGLVQIAPTTTAPVYGGAGPYSFRLVPSDTLQARFIARTIKSLWPEPGRVAIVYVNDDYGRGLYRQLRQHLGEVVFDGMYADNADEWELAALGRLIVTRQPELLIWLGRARPLGLLLPELRPRAPHLQVLCGDGCDGSVVYRNADGIFTGLVFVRFTDPRSGNVALSDFARRYHEHAGEPPSGEALLTYDAVSLVRAALRDGARTREHVRRYLASLGVERPPFHGLTGPIAFDSTGSVARPYLLAEVVAPDSVVPIRARGL
jgi:branched-chain amino acid transport system substrate-binding protein